MKNGFRVIDGDAHMQEPFDLWKDYVEPEFQDRRPVVKRLRWQDSLPLRGPPRALPRRQQGG